MNATIKQTLTDHQFAIARALGGEIKAPAKAAIIDKDWISKANQWWKENWNCLAMPALSQPPYILADTLGYINLKELANEEKRPTADG